MPGIQVGIYPGEETAGTEVSSTYEGRHLTVRDDELIHPVHADAFVDKGDPVVVCDAGVPATFGAAVGVALLSGTAAADWITLDTEGIWNLTVYAEDDNGNSAIEIGDRLYIRAGNLTGVASLNGLGDAEISKINNSANQIPFGYALGSMVAGGSGVIAVKVHWDPSLDTEDQMFKTVTSGAYNYGKQWVGLLEAGQSTGVAGYFCAQVDGAQTGGIYAFGVWMEPQSAMVADGSILAIYDGGFWCANGAGQDMSLARIEFCNFCIDIGENPATIHWFRVNVAATSGTMDAIFAAANPASIGYSLGTAGTGVVGTIPFADIVGHGLVYIDVHAAVA